MSTLRVSPCPFSAANDAAGAITALLRSLGEDTSRPGLRGTPERIARSLDDLTAGSRQTPEVAVGGAIFRDYVVLVVVKDIELCSLCEHHMLTFFGRAYVGYLADGRVIGLSKVPRLIEVAGWYWGNAMWKLRGALDLAVGGAGRRSGRRDPERFRVGEALDFWRVERAELPRPEGFAEGRC